MVTLTKSIGQSLFGRDIPVLRIKAVPNPEKAVVLLSGIHAREWISISTNLFLASKLLQNANQPEEAALLQNLELIFIPVVNPDGYEYSWTM